MQSYKIRASGTRARAKRIQLPHFSPTVSRRLSEIFAPAPGNCAQDLKTCMKPRATIKPTNRNQLPATKHRTVKPQDRLAGSKYYTKQQEEVDVMFFLHLCGKAYLTGRVALGKLPL
jgi:hypothetical protein